MEALQEREMLQAHQAAQPIALLGQALCQIQGVKEISTAHFNPWELVLQTRDAKRQISPKVARSFLALSGEGLVPSWVFSIVDIPLIKAAAS